MSFSTRQSIAWVAVVAVAPVGFACSNGGSADNGSADGDSSGSSAGDGGSASGGKAGSGGSSSPSGGNVGGPGGGATGGKAGGGTGGAATGGHENGSATGGGSPDGLCQESLCGSHKWACWKMPTPASESEAPNPQSYTDLKNGAVRDDTTCLIWEKDNPNEPGTWQHNFDRCAALAASGYAGYDDWRLPTRIEMASISDVTLGSTGYPDVFGVTRGYYVTGSFWYKTILTDADSTPDNETDMVWGYGTNGFTSNSIVRSNTDNVSRCVRGNGAGEAADEYAVEPPDHYSVSAGEVTDHYTGLVWQQGFSPSLLSFAESKSYCAALELGSVGGWRVPTLNELATTVNEARVGGAIVDAVFPENPEGCRAPEYWFWAAEASKVGGEGWGLSYCDGFTGWNVGDDGDWNYFPTANVRCVR
jgi:hypothetical protein